MCLILVSWRNAVNFPCVIAANRDEFHIRPALPAQWWPDHPHILGGRDLTAGGTWLGITRSGRFAALTNFRQTGGRRADAPSRGALVSTFLQSDDNVDAMLNYLRDVSARYSGFNMLFSDGESLGVYESTTGNGRVLGSGVYGLSNHLLDTPWPKVVNAKSRLSHALLELPDTTAALQLLRDEETAPDHLLPRIGVSLEWERLLSSAFIKSKDYGTRCSTLVRVARDRTVCFDEWTWDASGRETAHGSFQFLLE
jgi:uncharacterized protein with NRDE domain